MDARAQTPTFTGARRALVLLMATGGLCALALAFNSGIANAGVAPEATDVMFVFDTSGSMGGELEEAKSEITNLITQVNEELPNATFGVSNVEDVPSNGAGELSEEEYEKNDEKAWRLDQPLTGEGSKVVSAIDALTICSTGDGGTEGSCGGDGPEAYSRALWESDTNPNVGWRAGATHEIILIADNVPHEHELNEGIAESLWVENPFNTGEEPEGKFGIPGTVWAPGTDLKIQDVATQLGKDGKPLEMVDFKGEESGYLPYWEYWAGRSGGHALLGKPDSKELLPALKSLIEKGACTGGVCEKPKHSTSTQVSCTLVIATASDTCTATVGDAAATGPSNPTGTVTFTSSSGGVFSAGNSCTLVATPMSPNTSSCSVQFLPPTASSATPAITAAYGGDTTHLPSSGATTYPGVSELIGHVKLSGSGKILPGGKAVIPIECGFPCTAFGELLTGPGLAHLSSVTGGEVELVALDARSHGKKKKKHRPVLLGKGTLKLTKLGKGKLVIKLTGKARHALAHVGKKGVRITLKATIETSNGTLVAKKTQHVTLKPKAKKKHH